MTPWVETGDSPPHSRPEEFIYRSPSLAARLLRSLPYRLAYALGTTGREEFRSRSPLSMWQRLAYLRRGFLSEADALYDVVHQPLDQYISDFTRRFRCRNINALNEVFDHKLVMRAFLLAQGFRQPETVALIIGPRILGYPFSDEPRALSPAELEGLLGQEAGEYVVKPEDGGAGKGVALLKAGGGEIRWQRGQATGPWRSTDLNPGFLLIERRLRQHSFWEGLYPETGNSLRLLTLWTPGEAGPFVGRAVQRVGTAATVPTDNWSGGGISVLVEHDTGRLGLGRMHPLKGSHIQRQDFKRHPDSGAELEGAMIPDWDSICQTVLRAARHFPYNPYIGWDVLVDHDGVPVIVEANGNSDVNLLQVHGGLLADSRVRRFYQAYGIS